MKATMGKNAFAPSQVNRNALKHTRLRPVAPLAWFAAATQREKEHQQHVRKLKAEGRLWTLREPEPAPLMPTYNRMAKDPIRRYLCDATKQTRAHRKEHLSTLRQHADRNSRTVHSSSMMASASPV